MQKDSFFNKKHIVIEGPIGVGKSSLSQKMVDKFGGHLLLEKPAENPFLKRFYKSPERFSLATQLFFLFQRVQQLAEIDEQAKHLARPVIADFMIEKDPIFAELTLNAEELPIYQQVYNSLSIDQTQPDLVVYLQAPVEVLQQRIKKRNIAYELKIADNYLSELSTAYTEFFHRYTAGPLLIVNAAEFNPIDDEADFDALMAQISKITAGKHFFNPLS